ncbi:GDSL-type esterase/lipase family protein [Escherichia coli]|uniref:GDSL-type esterase/lipase family protein n=1 Tax=Escherichia coli TaxID=562 RepID=UPI001FCE4222|nr:GDSL-type esterase/lipase family protein [Escherichia coli]
MIYNLSIIRNLFITASMFILTSCSDVNLSGKSSPDLTIKKVGFLTNYNDPGIKIIADKLRHSESTLTHILVLGDSHIAADFFTGTLRHQFQRKYGNGGIGFISALRIPGNRYDNVHFEKTTGWKLIHSRNSRKKDFPFGGSIAFPTLHNNKVQIVLSADDMFSVARILYRTSGDSVVHFQNQTLRLRNTDGHWRFTDPVYVPSSFSFSADRNQRPEFAGIWLTAMHSQGVIVSSLGINGAQISMLDRWEKNWVDTLAQIKPDMVILAYGTNEAFSSDISVRHYQETLIRQIRAIRQANPDVAVLLIGPGSSIRNKNMSECMQRQPVSLKKIISVQKEVSGREHTLFWDWFSWMGGDCSVDRWTHQGKAAKDRIHLTPEGYRESALSLWNEFQEIIRYK